LPAKQSTPTDCRWRETIGLNSPGLPGPIPPFGVQQGLWRFRIIGGEYINLVGEMSRHGKFSQAARLKRAAKPFKQKPA